MRIRLAWCCVTILALLGGRLASADDWNQTPADPDGSLAMANRVSMLAQRTVRGEKMSAAAWQEDAALLTAATRLSPKDPRLARQLADAYQQLHDIDNSIASIKAYRALASDDQTAQTQQIDLYLTRMQSADVKLDYLKALLNTQLIPPEVRSFAAMRSAQVMLQQTKTPDAIKMVGTAIALNPLNGPALRIKYDLTEAAATPLERVGDLLAMLKANPADPSVATLLAGQLADVGLVQESMWWYSYANKTYTAGGITSDSTFAHGAASEMVLTDRADDAVKLLDAYLSALPGDADAWDLRVAIAKYSMDQNKDDKAFKSGFDAVAREAGIALTNTLAQLRQQLGVATATTQPIDGPTDATVPNLAGDVALVKKSSDANVARAYIDVVTSLAWYELYFKHDANAADPLITTLAQLLDEHDVTLTRLQGWRELVNGAADAATVKLSAVQDRDAYAALGMIQVNLNNPAKHDDVVAQAKKLMADHPSGVIGAIVFEAVRSLGVTVSPTAAADPIQAILQAFPQDYIQLMQQPQACYLFQVDPVQNSVDFGDPILMRVTLQNICGVPFSLGSTGALHSNIWFDAFLRGQLQQPVPGVANERMDSRLTLAPNQQVTTVMRVDGGALNDVMMSNPTLTLTINFTGCTNPLIFTTAQNPQPQAGAGPIGYRIQSTGMVQRPGTVIATAADRTALMNRVLHGQPEDKIRVAQALASLAMQIKAKAGASPDELAIADDFMDKLKDAQSDSAMSVRSWAKYIGAIVAKTDARQQAIDAMAASPDWETRLLSLNVATSLDDHGAAIASKLAPDPDAAVKAYALAIQQLLATQPTTMPSAGPSVGPTTAPTTGPAL